MKNFAQSYLSYFRNIDYAVSEYNSHAYSNLKALLKKKGSGLLVIYGPVGCGKSHLLAASMSEIENTFVAFGTTEFSHFNLPLEATVILENMDIPLKNNPEQLALQLRGLLSTGCRVIVTCGSPINLDCLPQHRLFKISNPTGEELGYISKIAKRNCGLDINTKYKEERSWKTPREISNGLYKVLIAAQLNV